MKLLLSSAGLVSEEVKKEFRKEIKSLKTKKLCLICYEMKEGFREWLEEKEEEFRVISPDIELIILNLSEDVKVDEIPESDVYYVSGGNTFYILSRMKEFGIDKFLQNEIGKNKFYFGVSAGSIIAGQDIERFASVCGDANDVKLKDCKGFELIPFDIIPHYVADQETEVMKYYNENDNPVVALTDKQAVLITDEEMEIIGPENEGLLLD